MDWTATAAAEEEVIVISSDSDGEVEEEATPAPMKPFSRPPAAAAAHRGRPLESQSQPQSQSQPDDSDDELLDPDEDDIFSAGAWPTFGQTQLARTSPAKSSASEESTSPPPSPVKQPKRKSKQLAPAKITFAKPQSKPKSAPEPVPSTSTSKSKAVVVSSAEEDDDEEEDDLVSYRVTKKNPNPKPPRSGKDKDVDAASTDKKAAAQRAAQAKALQKAEREKKKANEAREKELKKNANELRKNSKPGEAFKFMTVLLDPNFPHKEAVEKILDAAEVRYANSTGGSLLLENSILFERETVYQAMGDDLKLHKRSRFDEEDQIFVYLEPDEIVPKVAAQMKAGGGEDWSEAAASGGGAHEEDEFELDLVTYVTSLQSTFPKKIITLVLYGMDAYFKKIKKNAHQEFRQQVLNGDGTTGSPKKRRRKKAEALPTITQFDFQSALIELQLKTGINYRIVNTAKDLGLLLVQYTKAIADAPFKRAQREQSSFDWYALADTSGSIKVDKNSGAGLSALWIEQLQQFNKIGVDSAMAIVRKYPTPLELVEAYERCRNQEEGQGLLKDITVRTGFGPLQKTRKLGPEASKKLFRFFTSTDPERCLGSTTSF